MMFRAGAMPAATSEIVSFDDLRFLSTARCPCITAVVTMPDPMQVRTHMKNAVHQIEKRLPEMGLDAQVASALLEPIRAIAADIEMQRDWAITLVLFRSPELLRCFSMREPFKDSVTIGTHFHIRPLFSALAREQQFFMLALSQKHVRLYRCTQHSIQEIPWGQHAPPDFQVWMNIRMPDHDLENRSSAGVSAGSSKGVVFGTNTDREHFDEYLLHYFKVVDKAVCDVLRGETAPLMVAAVEPDVALYRRVSAHPKLMERAVHGSPNGLSPRELHKRALEIVRQVPSGALSKVLKSFAEHGGNQRVSLSLMDILKASFEGRLACLLIREDAEFRGKWDGVGEQIFGGDEDLLNLAALQTLSHRGQVFALPQSEIPQHGDAAAALRF
jgi:hypothetical protein